MRKRNGRRFSTHDFARTLLRRRDEYVRCWVFGRRLSIFWDTREPAPKKMTTAEFLGRTEEEVPRPDYCCGLCPPIVGGGYDCTCKDNPRCGKR